METQQIELTKEECIERIKTFEDAFDNELSTLNSLEESRLRRYIYSDGKIDFSNYEIISCFENLVYNSLYGIKSQNKQGKAAYPIAKEYFSVAEFNMNEERYPSISEIIKLLFEGVRYSFKYRDGDSVNAHNISGNVIGEPELTEEGIKVYKIKANKVLFISNMPIKIGEVFGCREENIYIVNNEFDAICNEFDDKLYPLLKSMHEQNKLAKLLIAKSNNFLKQSNIDGEIICDYHTDYFDLMSQLQDVFDSTINSVTPSSEVIKYYVRTRNINNYDIIESLIERYIFEH